MIDYGLWLLLLIAAEVTDLRELTTPSYQNEGESCPVMLEELLLRVEPYPLLRNADRFPDPSFLDELRAEWWTLARLATAGAEERLYHCEEYLEIKRECHRHYMALYSLSEAQNPAYFVWTRRGYLNEAKMRLDADMWETGDVPTP